MGCYPLFTCRDWTRVREDLDEIADDLVSVVVVADPFGDYDVKTLSASFGDFVLRYKEHFVADLSRSYVDFVSRHHRYYARRALKELTVEVCAEPIRHFEEWLSLYARLVRRHDVSGPAAFSEECFRKQFGVPGMEMLRVHRDGVTLGAQLWFVQGDVGYSHLTALSELGYRMRASYALYWSALEHFSGRLGWLDLGASTGVSSDHSDGLSMFKRGWASGSRAAHLCGRILDHRHYNDLVERSGPGITGFFPAYRADEYL